MLRGLSYIHTIVIIIKLTVSPAEETTIDRVCFVVRVWQHYLVVLGAVLGMGIRESHDTTMAWRKGLRSTVSYLDPFRGVSLTILRAVRFTPWPIETWGAYKFGVGVSAKFEAIDNTYGLDNKLQITIKNTIMRSSRNNSPSCLMNSSGQRQHEINAGGTFCSHYAQGSNEKKIWRSITTLKSRLKSWT